jgi:hypothetical protein
MYRPIFNFTIGKGEIQTHGGDGWWLSKNKNTTKNFKSNTQK